MLADLRTFPCSSVQVLPLKRSDRSSIVHYASLDDHRRSIFSTTKSRGVYGLTKTVSVAQKRMLRSNISVFVGHLYSLPFRLFKIQWPSHQHFLRVKRRLVF